MPLTYLFIKVLLNVVILKAVNRGIAPQLLEFLLNEEVDPFIMIKDYLFLVCLSCYPQQFLVQLL